MLVATKTPARDKVSENLISIQALDSSEKPAIWMPRKHRNGNVIQTILFFVAVNSAWLGFALIKSFVFPKDFSLLNPTDVGDVQSNESMEEMLQC